MPPFYYTVLIPLVDLNDENGSTVFIPGSHKLSHDEAKDLPRRQFDVAAGSVIIFDGRIFHYGPANKVESGETRVVLYQVYHSAWYYDVSFSDGAQPEVIDATRYCQGE
jgi:ectoine hydroxylase-related dioxygenase (phytanoyl-CoA dioxygenase family)